MFFGCFVWHYDVTFGSFVSSGQLNALGDGTLSFSFFLKSYLYNNVFTRGQDEIPNLAGKMKFPRPVINQSACANLQSLITKKDRTVVKVVKVFLKTVVKVS